MSRKLAAWLSDEPTPDLPTLTTLELVKVWSTNRNSLLSTMAGEEIMKRLYKEHEEQLNESVHD